VNWNHALLLLGVDEGQRDPAEHDNRGQHQPARQGLTQEEHAANPGLGLSRLQRHAHPIGWDPRVSRSRLDTGEQTVHRPRPGAAHDERCQAGQIQQVDFITGPAELSPGLRHGQ
jgi:hypothetical protein